MSLEIADRVSETTTTSGTGTVNLAGARSGFQSFVAGIGNGNTCHYLLLDGTAWETGIGTVTDASPDTLARTTLISSSTGSKISLSGGTTIVSCVLPGNLAALEAIIRLVLVGIVDNADAVALTIDSSERVGIGNASPLAQLHVGPGADTPYTNTIVLVSGNGGSNLSVRDATNNVEVIHYAGTQGYLGTVTEHNLDLLTNTVARLRFFGSGNIIWAGDVADSVANMAYGALRLSAGGSQEILGLRNGFSSAGKQVRFIVDSGNTLYIANETGTPGYIYLTDGGTSWTGTSDRNLKDGLKPIANARERLLLCNGYTGWFKSDKEKKIRPFLIAQEWQEALPESVTENEVKLDDKEQVKKTLGLTYTETLALIVPAVNENSILVDELIKIVENLSAEFQELKNNINGMVAKAVNDELTKRVVN